MFLAGTDTKWLAPKEAAPALFSETVHSLLVVESAVPTVMDAARKLDMHLAEVAQIQGYNYSRGRFVTLRVFAEEKRISKR